MASSSQLHDRLYRIIILFDVIVAGLCVWWILGVVVSLKYDVDQSLGLTREQILEVLNDHLYGMFGMLLFFFATMVVNAIVIILLHRRSVGAA